MEGLFEAILKNPFLILIVLGGIVSLLRGKSKQENQRNKQEPNRPKPTMEPIGNMNQTEHRPIEKQTRSPISHASIEEQQKKQMKRLADQMKTNVSAKIDHVNEDILQVQNKLSPDKHDKFRKQIKGKLTQNGLVDSIIMAEALGQPRARKPYQNIIMKRRSK